jgi:Sec-independent protein secretion pathway component TatC
LEIKYRGGFSLITWSFLVVNCYYFKETLLYVLMRSSFHSKKNNLLYFLTTDVAEAFVAYVKLSFYFANQITMMFLLYHSFLFLSAGFYKFERAYARLLVTTTIFCWTTSVFMLNNFVFSITWDFFFKFQDYLSFQSLTFHFEIKLNEYLIFYKSIYCLCNLILQAAALFFVFLDLFRTNLPMLKKLRKSFYFSFFIFSTFVTPPEVSYQLVMSICLTSIYELVIFYMVLRTELDTFK